MVSPRKLLLFDERVVHEDIDRLVLADNAKGLVEYTRGFVTRHFETLRLQQGVLKTLVAWLFLFDVCGAIELAVSCFFRLRRCQHWKLTLVTTSKAL